MANSLSNPKIAVSVTANVTCGSAPAATTCTLNHSTVSIPSVGRAAGQIDRVYAAPFVVTAGTPLVLDCTNLVDPLGNTLAFGHITTIFVSNDSTIAGQDFTVGGGTHPLTGDSHTVQAGGGAALIHAPAGGFAGGAGAA